MLSLIRLIRPEQWVKNGFVLMPLVFARGLTHPGMVRNAALAFFSFCLAASGTYSLNDLVDADSDGQHPDKRQRPVASGEISKVGAMLTSIVLWGSSVALSLLLNPGVTLTIAAYLAVNLAYSYCLKRVAILDVFALASGYVLRILAGAVALGMSATPWILVVAFFISLVLGFGKRRSEIAVLKDGAPNHRASLGTYSATLLDTFVVISVSSTLISYAIYAVETSSKVGGANLVLTIPFVVFGLFRYLYILLASKQADNPTRLVLTDHPIQVSVIGWFFAVVMILYLH